ncbi:NUDIX hydrolase [Alicyclobacillus acidocaldarius]|uniref:NUDIX hydrolase n=1 Tax=Alicyclobacillus acidocaldarius subsp. acidocaldarius (strain ATCC 27009 / DSM 446 / BCRC 14685 / JCM 5260 / KCTC 1825 / NBRC 15652 / NCIMB 11725 / NRRL B-14509 / 104-IA) TaxID=521098 RepID=C8WXE4_ALIAD|nr:NUDIX hydrolase [Alicyclobacillus acidocaldarius]ACV58766.1 NUDIX hydrolase [Alicyclobacillus acidocaldarius subsp. acidocaldarius DSM 446]
MWEQTVAEERLFTGRIIDVRRLTVKLPNGHTSTREVVLHPGAVAVLAEVEPDKVVLVRQFRKPCEQVLWEIPAGKLEPGEEPERAAARELSEETGYQCEGPLVPVHAFYTAPGFSNEKLHVYYTNDVKRGAEHPDGDEFVESQVFSRDEIRRMLGAGEIQDAKTLVALYWWMARL